MDTATEHGGGAELKEGDAILVHARFVAWCDPPGQHWEPKPHSSEPVAQVMIEHPHVGWTLIHEVVASAVSSRPAQPAAPDPSGSGGVMSDVEHRFWAAGQGYPPAGGDVGALLNDED